MTTINVLHQSILNFVFVKVNTMIDGIDLEINDLFEADNDDPPREREDDDGNNSKNEESTAVKPRKVVRNPQPKLNPERLGGSRGLVQLPKIFSEVVLKGEGHEKENLDVVMKTIEHWSYRLFPRFPFDDVLDKIEKLGAKKQVQTCLKKIRLDMLTEDDFAPIGNDGGARAGLSDSPPVNPLTNDDRFDDIFTNQTAQPEPTIQSQITPTAITASVLTDEQIERMERNRRLAMERRALKLQQTATQPPEPLEYQQTKSMDLQRTESLDFQPTESLDFQPTEEDVEQKGTINDSEMLNENELLAFIEDAM